MKVLGICRKIGSDSVLLNVGNDVVDAFAVRVKPGTVPVEVDDPVTVKGDGLVWVKGVPMKMESL